MNPQDELLEIIDTYLSKGMSEEERFAFEERLAVDEALAAKVNEIRLTNQAIYYASLAELKNTIGKDIKNIKYKEPFNWKKASFISVASLALISGITIYLITGNNNVESSKRDTTKKIQETKKNTVEKNNVSSTQDKTINNKGYNQEHPLTKDMEDSISGGITSPEKLYVPTDNSIKHPEQIKPIEQENTVPSNTSDATPKQITTPVTDNKIACDKSFKINTEASCKQKETGSITIISDGAYSYMFQIDIRSITGSKGMFTNMSEGVYDILVTYGKECTYKKQVSIGEKWCAMNESYSFNPDYNEKWVFSYEAGASGTFTIFDKSGKDIYRNTFGSGNEEWNGNDRQGIPVPVGVYFAFINYSDGRKEKVELTIVR